MSISILNFFSPKDKKIFPLFEKASLNLVHISEVLVQYVNSSSPEKQKELYHEIEKLEKLGDSTSQEVFHAVSVSLISPFDREDLHALISAISYIVDYVHGSVKRIELYKPEKMTPTIIKFAELIQKSAEELNRAVIELRSMKNITKIKEATVKINSIENHADDVFNTALAKLLEEEKNMIEVIKMKDILTSLETATDMFEDAASVINNILVKNA